MEFKTYENKNGGRVRAHVVTEDSARRVQKVDGTGHDAKAGDLLIASDRPDSYHIGSKADLEGWSELSDTDSEVTTPEVVDSEDEEVYDPSKHSAGEVRDHLDALRSRGERDEFERVANAEKNGKNRATVNTVW